MSNRMRKINRGIATTPGQYDGYDVLHHTMKKFVNGENIPTGMYSGLVIHVKKSTVPGVPYEVMAWIPELSPTKMPEIVHDPKKIKLEEIIGLKYYKPIDEDMEMPIPGQVIDLMISDTKNCIGKYMGPSKNKTIPSPTVNKKEDASGAKASIESGNNVFAKDVQAASIPFFAQELERANQGIPGQGPLLPQPE